MSVDLKAIRERAEKATPGPWEASGRKDEYWVQPQDGHVEFYTGYEGEIRQADADFIAHAREDIPALLERVRVLEEALHKLRETIAANAADTLWMVGEFNMTAVEFIEFMVGAAALSPERMPSDER